MCTTVARASRVVLLASVLCALPVAVSACAWDGIVDVAEDTFFDPAVVADPGCEPLFATPYERFGPHHPARGPQPDFTAVNLDEWDGFFAGKIPRETWSALLYEAELTRLDGLIFLLKGQAGAPRLPGDEAFLAYPDRKRLIAALYYVGFAKRVAVYATERSGDYWEWQEQQETVDPAARAAAIAALTAGGDKALAAASIPFLRQRYAFQLVRLAFYGGEPERAVALYDQHRAAFADGSSVAWRALGFVAGAHYRARRYAQANYLYSLIFDRYQPLRLVAAWSFRPQEEEDWRACLALARSDRERAVLWQLLGLSVDGLRAMREIRAIEPGSDLLALLLVREVAHAEMEASVTGLYGPPAVPSPAFLELLQLVEETVVQGGVREPWLWDLAAGHLRAMQGAMAIAERHLAAAEQRASGNVAALRQVRLSRLYAELQNQQAVDRAAEPRLARELAWLEAEAGDGDSSRPATLFAWAKRRLAGLYREGGDTVTAVCLHQRWEEPFYADPAAVDRLVAFLARPDKSAFEAFVAGQYGFDRAELDEVNGLNALYAGEVEEAARLLVAAGDAPLPADPFEMHLRDNHDRDAERPGHAAYSKAAAARRLAELQRTAAAGGPDAAAAWYEAGVAWYNFSWFGNSRLMYVTPGELFVKRPRIDDTSRAETCFKRAHDLAGDRELKARAAFMAAKCELAAYHARDPELTAGDFVAGRWFATLADRLADTAYYQEVLAECGYFRTYLDKRGPARLAGGQ